MICLSACPHLPWAGQGLVNLQAVTILLGLRVRRVVRPLTAQLWRLPTGNLSAAVHRLLRGTLATVFNTPRLSISVEVSTVT